MVHRKFPPTPWWDSSKDVVACFPQQITYITMALFPPGNPVPGQETNMKYINAVSWISAAVVIHSEILIDVVMVRYEMSDVLSKCTLEGTSSVRVLGRIGLRERREMAQCCAKGGLLVAPTGCTSDLPRLACIVR